MTGRTIDIAIVGGGLAGGLAALAIHSVQPALRLAVFESGDTFGGNHRWSWFDSDLDQPGHALLDLFPTMVWAGGYDVRFPGFDRTLASPYRSLASRDFDATLRRHLPQDSLELGSRVSALDGDGVVLESGRRVDARIVLDCREAGPSQHLQGGWQVFMGRHIRLDRLHGLTRPIVMDASVRQHNAYRFVYTLPLGPDEIFVEDTYYADSPVLDRAALSERIENYCAAHGWTGKTVGEETGVLPVITGGDFAAYRAGIAQDGAIAIGARGGFTHPLTSYTLPFAVDNALAIARNVDLPREQLRALFDRRARDHWRDTAFYRHLARMLFLGAEAEERYRVFAHFYRLPEPLVERFYAGRSTLADKARVLVGKPPIAIPAAVRALLGKGAPLVHEGMP